MILSNREVRTFRIRESILFRFGGRNVREAGSAAQRQDLCGSWSEGRCSFPSSFDWRPVVDLASFRQLRHLREFFLKYLFQGLIELPSNFFAAQFGLFQDSGAGRKRAASLTCFPLHAKSPAVSANASRSSRSEPSRRRSVGWGGDGRCRSRSDRERRVGVSSRRVEEGRITYRIFRTFRIAGFL
jgi:hypothetical protein